MFAQRLRRADSDNRGNAFVSQPDGRKLPATRVGMKFVTFPVSREAKRQLDYLAVETGLTREDLMKKALVGLFREYGKAELT